MSLALSTAPDAEPVGLEQLKAYIGFTVDDDNARLTATLRAARQYVEAILWRQLITATYTWKLDCFSRSLWVPRPPLQSVTSITYVDLDGNSQTLDTSIYQVVTGDNPVIVEAYGEQWPSTLDKPEAVTVTYVAGYGDDADDIPHPIREAILMTAGNWFMNPACMGDAMPAAAKWMIDAYTVRDERRLVGV